MYRLERVHEREDGGRYAIPLGGSQGESILGFGMLRDQFRVIPNARTIHVEYPMDFPVSVRRVSEGHHTFRFIVPEEGPWAGRTCAQWIVEPGSYIEVGPDRTLEASCRESVFITADAIRS